MREFKNVMVLGTLCGAVAIVGLTGCSWQKEKEAKETGRTTAQVSTDNSISDRVSDQLKTAPIYKYPDVHVNAFNGTVQLSGFVHNQGQKEEATHIAQSVPGVNGVHNDLVVQPLTPTGRTTNGVNQPYQAPVVTPPQNVEGQQPQQQPQQQAPQAPPPQPPPPSPPSNTNSSSQP
jgi:hypothetical protein